MLLPAAATTKGEPDKVVGGTQLVLLAGEAGLVDTALVQLTDV